jgi:hypothetical protein
MAEKNVPYEFEEVPLEEARRMGRRLRMDPRIYVTLRQTLSALGNQAVRVHLDEKTPPNTMRQRILRIAAELHVPVTIRRVPGGLVFWRSQDEDLQQARQISQRLQRIQQWRAMARPQRRRQPRSRLERARSSPP